MTKWFSCSSLQVIWSISIKGILVSEATIFFWKLEFISFLLCRRRFDIVIIMSKFISFHNFFAGYGVYVESNRIVGLNPDKGKFKYHRRELCGLKKIPSPEQLWILTWKSPTVSKRQCFWYIPLKFITIIETLNANLVYDLICT